MMWSWPGKPASLSLIFGAAALVCACQRNRHHGKDRNDRRFHLRCDPDAHRAVELKPMQLQSYACGQWLAGRDRGVGRRDATSGEIVGNASSTGLDFAAMLSYAR